jgi:hypothetical protein
MLFNFIDWIFMLIVGLDSSVGTTTRYGLDGLGIESLWGRELPQPSRPALGSNRGTKPLSRGKEAGSWL